MSDPRLLKPERYAPALPDIGHVMAELESLHRKVDALAGIMHRLLESLAEDPDPDAEDVRTLDGDTAGAERDASQPL